MISEDEFDDMCIALEDLGASWRYRAGENTDKDFLCGVFDGLADAAYIAAGMIGTQAEVASIDEYKNLRSSIRTYIPITYSQKSDFLEGVQKGRRSGEEIVTIFLDAIAPEDWAKKAKEDEDWMNKLRGKTE